MGGQAQFSSDEEDITLEPELDTSFDDLTVSYFSGVKIQRNDVPEPDVSEFEPVESDISDLPTYEEKHKLCASSLW